MKFNFKIQQYQTDAVDAVVCVFQGQGFHDKISYIRDMGTQRTDDVFFAQDMQMSFIPADEQLAFGDIDGAGDTGYKNEAVQLSDEQLLHNIQTLQNQNNIKLSTSLVKDLGRCSLDIEMETGTGKNQDRQYRKQQPRNSRIPAGKHGICRQPLYSGGK